MGVKATLPGAANVNARGAAAGPADRETDSGSADGEAHSAAAVLAANAPDHGVPDVQRDLIELMHLMPRVVRGLKRGSGESQFDGAKTALRTLFKEGMLGPRHVPVLIVLVIEGPMSVGALARRLDLNLATVSLMVGELARTGLVERRQDETDRRRVFVSINAKHRRQLAPFVSQRVAPLRRALERMPDELRRAFVAGWRLLADEIEANGSKDAGTP